MIETKEKKERFVLFAVSETDEEETISSLEELAELTETAGGEVLELFLQSLDHPNPGTYLGSGKIEELKERVRELEADGVICDDELSPAQMKNLSDLLQVKVLDRTLLILDIFAGRAQTREGKIQVELAQLKYRATRLTGQGTSLSRLGGGIGTRGPGESKLEADRRAIHRRIGQLKAELEEVVKHREVQRERRQKGSLPVAAIVGYTNAGKSTLLNVLTGAGILAEDKLFATLDPTTRNLKLPGGEEVLLTDTVGFINKLPHQLIDAFKSTLEEARYADVLIHVVDATSPRMKLQMDTVYRTLKELQVEDKPVITLFNKCDLGLDQLTYDGNAREALRVSAKTGKGLDRFQESLSRLMKEQKVYLDRIFAYKDAGLIALIRRQGTDVKEEYLDEGIHVTAMVPRNLGV